MTTSEIGPTALRRLLIEITDSQLDIKIRFRLLGMLWYPQFVKIVGIDDDMIMLFDLTSSKNISIKMINIIQLELDTRFQTYQPNNHYSVWLKALFRFLKICWIVVVGIQNAKLLLKKTAFTKVKCQYRHKENWSSILTCEVP